MTSPTPTGHADVIIYDLDGVITTRDSFAALIVEQLRKAPLRFLRALPAAMAMFLGVNEEWKRQAAARVTAIAFAGMRDYEYAALATAFGIRIGDDPSWIRASTAERIRRQKADGAWIIIATATERRLAESLLEQASVPYDSLSASLLTETACGVEVDDHRVGQRKADALREQGIAIHDAEFVTDSMTDLPTARLAARVTLIGASQKTRERYSRRGISPTEVTP
ncbi:haloacid dehalogenase-like hydrolase [Acidipropionibacterium virtanenii]|nr:haloacid dehalogenase-like hydrolase [Acidipropionibacterium virtanenii]